MKTLEWTTRDKQEWGDGPWMNEPDKMQWLDEETKLPCLIVRNRMGSLCGYVGVTRSHPSYQKDYDKVPVEAHGGLTFSNKCRPGETEEEGVCHIVEPGEDDDVWWLGFDCGHCFDLSPHIFGVERKMLKMMGEADSKFKEFQERETKFRKYRDVAYVKGQIKDLAKQLASLPQ